MSDTSPLPITELGTATAVSKTYSISQDSGLNLSNAVSVTLPYAITGLSANDKLTAAYFDSGFAKWVPISNGVDNRIAGKFTFETMHFSEWAIFKLIRNSVLPPSFDKGFNPINDGIPINNFGVAVSPDGATSYEDGSCAGMAGLAGWYWQFQQKTEGTASMRFGDNLATRTYVAMLHSRFRIATDELSFFNLFKFTFTLSPNAAANVKEKLHFNQAPVIAQVMYLGDRGLYEYHYVLVYKYDSAGRFYYYDPNHPGLEKWFDTSALGGIKDWNVFTNKSVISFRLYGLVGELIKMPDLLEMYSKFKSGSEYPSWGKITANTRIQTTDNNKIVEVNGSVSTVTNLAGKPLYVHYFTSKNNLINPFTGAEPLQQIRPREKPNQTDVGISVGSFVAGGSASFGATFNSTLFKANQSNINLKIIISTNSSNYYEA